MQAYMKSSMPFHGVAMPVLRDVLKPLLRALEFDSGEAFEAAVRELWHHARFREERYAALVLLRLPKSRPFITLPLLEELISTGAWWDLVDELATHHVHAQLAKPATRRTLRGWSQGTDLWLRRAAIICQVGAKADTDVGFLLEMIAPALDSKEFFLRKAIGWALRAVGPWHPRVVESWLDEHAERASGLTKREALKSLDPARRKR
jgi:3-methyladenine DNA glycosylase AlkD